jgi:hypothetical protein
MAGNKNSGKRKDRAFHTALMLELAEAETGRDLRAIARNVISVALDAGHKDMLSAAGFIADRIDGKPVSTVDMNISDNRTVEELSDTELADLIRTNSGPRASESEDGAEESGIIH